MGDIWLRDSKCFATLDSADRLPDSLTAGNKWKVSIQTGDKDGAGARALVLLF